MTFDYSVLDDVEKIIFSLRSLYSKYGYTRYRMGKFEEYDLYVNNKDFLVSDAIITFTDTNGKLMALKPDVTLSIVKNNKDRPDSLNKLYYNENVYRVSKGTNSFKEIMQTGLECMGKVDDTCIGEVLYLAAESLNTIRSDFILEISNLEILSACVETITNVPSVKKDIIKCASEKNVHGITEVCSINNIPCSQADPLKDLLGFYGDPEKVISLLRSSTFSKKIRTETDKLEKAVSIFEGTSLSRKVVIDFSLVGDTNYYNGIIFKGFLNGLPGGVLSGGQYDKLMSKMGRTSKAIGFAVYLDMLDRLN